jgi:DNA (cytosine-5)-methyltransferase 1
LRDITPSGSETQGTANIALECVEQPNKTAFGFHGHKSITGNICYNEERSPCLETKMPPNVMVYDYNRQDARITECDDKAQTVLAKYGTGGNNTPIVCVQGNTIERSDTAGANGKGVIEDTSYTLNTADRHAVAYCLDRASYNQGKNAQFDISIQEELAQTCVAKGPHAVCHAAEVYTIGNGQTDQLRLHDKALTLNCMHDQQIALLPDDWDYIVRRLTPLECCRLQGFPDWWAWGLETPEPSEDDILYWSDVHEQHRIITKPINKKTGELVAAKTRNQIIKWIKDPQNDGAEYKMWGNSLAIPCAYTVLAGIAEEMRVTT